MTKPKGKAKGKPIVEPKTVEESLQDQLRTLLSDKATFSPKQLEQLRRFDKYVSTANGDRRPLKLWTRVTYLRNLKLLAKSVNDFDKATSGDILRTLQPLGLANRKLHFQAFSNFFSFLQAVGEADIIKEARAQLKNNNIGGRGGRTSEQDEVPEAITVQEFSKLLQACRNQGTKALVHFLGTCGCRIGEAVQLRLKDVELSEPSDSTITVKVPTEKRARSVPAIRTVVLCDPSLYADMVLWIRNHPRKGDREAPLFCRLDGRTYSYQSLKRIVRRISNEAIGKSLGPHSLRHYAASQDGRFMTETALAGKFGWVPHSPMISRYIHSSQQAAIEQELQRWNKAPPKSVQVESIPVESLGAVPVVSNRLKELEATLAEEQKAREQREEYVTHMETNLANMQKQMTELSAAVATLTEALGKAKATKAKKAKKRDR